MMSPRWEPYEQWLYRTCLMNRLEPLALWYGKIPDDLRKEAIELAQEDFERLKKEHDNESKDTLGVREASSQELQEDKLPDVQQEDGGYIVCANPDAREDNRDLSSGV